MDHDTKNNYLIFGFDKDTNELLPSSIALLAWWQQLDNNTGARASLRRCHNINDIMFIPEFYRLFYNLKKTNKVYDNSLAVVVGVLAHVRENTSIRLSTQMASSKNNNENPIITRARLNKLISINSYDIATNDDKNELLTRLINIVKMLGDEVNVLDIANVAYSWNDRTKKSLISGYHNKLYDNQ